MVALYRISKANSKNNTIMKNYLKFTGAVIFMLMQFVTTVVAQPTNKPPDRMKMLNAFNGEWKGEMVTVEGKKKIKYKLSHTSQKIAGGWGVQLSEVAMIPEKGKYQAARIFSNSSTGDTTYMYTIDSYGETWMYKGVWVTNKHLLVKAVGDNNGVMVSKTISYSFLSPKEYEYKSITQSEGVEDEIVEMKMARQ